MQRLKQCTHRIPKQNRVVLNNLLFFFFPPFSKKEKSICFIPRSYNTGQATFALPLLIPQPAGQSASRPKVLSPTHATKQIIPGNSAAPYSLPRVCSACGLCMFLVRRNERTEQRAARIHETQLNLQTCFTLLSPINSALNNKLLLQSILHKRSTEHSLENLLGAIMLNDNGRTGAAADKSPPPQFGGRFCMVVGDG